MSSKSSVRLVSFSSRRFLTSSFPFLRSFCFFLFPQRQLHPFHSPPSLLLPTLVLLARPRSLVLRRFPPSRRQQGHRRSSAHRVRRSASVGDGQESMQDGGGEGALGLGGYGGVEGVGGGAGGLEGVWNGFGAGRGRCDRGDSEGGERMD